MSETHFERLVTAAMAKIKDATLGVVLNEPTSALVSVARLQGRHEGLKLALDLQRQAAGVDAGLD